MAVKNLLATLSRPPLGPARVPNPDGLLAETRHDDYHCRAMTTCLAINPCPSALRKGLPARYFLNIQRTMTILQQAIDMLLPFVRVPEFLKLRHVRSGPLTLNALLGTLPK